MKTTGTLVAVFAVVAAAVGCAVALFSHALAPDRTWLPLVLDCLATSMAVAIGAAWAAKTRPASLSVQDDDYYEKLQATRAPYVLIASFLAMLAAAFAGHFHGHAGFLSLLGALAFGVVTVLTALFAELDMIVSPFLLMILFMGESTVVLIATAP